jgi:hypothetical protein
MTTTVSGSYPAVNSDSDATINGLTVGKGTGNFATNTAIGFETLKANTTGEENVAVGYRALDANTTGTNSIAMGRNALGSNTTGSSNVAIGDSALVSNTTASSNAAFGSDALGTNTTGANNVAVGRSALQANTTASNNTAVGYQAGYSQQTGVQNTYIGVSAGYTDKGLGNTFLGHQAGYTANSGANVAAVNTCVGYNAGYNLTTGKQNCFIGGAKTTTGFGAGTDITTGSSNTIIGSYTGNQGGLDIRTSSNYIVLSDGDGNPRTFINDNGSMVIGNFHAPVYTTTKLSIKSPDGGVRLVDFNNNRNVSGDENLRIQLGSNCSNTASYFLINTIDGVGDRLYMYGNGTVQNSTGSYGAFSDIKLKENVIDATPKLNSVMQLRVRNFNLIGDNNKQIGFVAQEIEQVFPSIVDNTPDKDKDGKETGEFTKGVKLTVLIPILVKAIQELNAKVEAQALEIAQLKGN